MSNKKKVKEKEIILDYPIEHGSETIEKLVLKRPKGKHIRNLPAEPSVGDFLDMAGKLSGHPPSVMDELDAVDVEKVSEAIEGFLARGQKTGESG